MFQKLTMFQTYRTWFVISIFADPKTGESEQGIHSLPSSRASAHSQVCSTKKLQFFPLNNFKKWVIVLDQKWHGLVIMALKKFADHYLKATWMWLSQSMQLPRHTCKQLERTEWLPQPFTASSRSAPKSTNYPAKQLVLRVGGPIGFAVAYNIQQ